MTQPHTSVSGKRPVEYPLLRRLLKNAILAEEERLAPNKYTLDDAAKQMGITRSTFVDIKNGHRKPNKEECVVIAHRYDLPVEEMLRLAGHRDVQGLLQFVEEETAEESVNIRRYIVDMLHFALKNDQWQKLDWRRSVYRERADAALGLVDDRQRARWYADAVWDWYQNRGKPDRREMRQTGEILASLP